MPVVVQVVGKIEIHHEDAQKFALYRDGVKLEEYPSLSEAILHAQSRSGSVSNRPRGQGADNGKAQ